MAKILIVDDDPQLRKSFQKILTEEGYTLQTASTGEAGIWSVEQDTPDLVIMDVRMPGMNGLEAFKAMHKTDPKLPVIIMTAFGTTDTAIEATKAGAFDYVLKPFEIPDILDLIKKALQAGSFMHSKVQINASPENTSNVAIVGKSQPMQEIYKSIGRVAPTDATVLIRGESGTGKELVAKAIYNHSLRNDKPYLVINCVAIPETLLESELFGYEKGAFSGAVSRRIGKIERANKGTIFLDEIGDMPFNIQAKILRLLQEKSIERLGGREPVPVDVRIIAATNRDLEKAVSSGKFREDLYYRLNVVNLTLPRLNERKDDLPILTEYFMEKFSREMNTPYPGITANARDALFEYSWPGNVRELANIIQKAIIFSQGCPLERKSIIRATHGKDNKAGDKEVIDDEHFEKLFREWVKNKITLSSCDNLFDSIMDSLAGAITREALDFTSGNRSQAAKLLGISRPTLISKIDKYKVKIKTSVL